MPNYRRAIKPGGTFFLTLVTEGRAPVFAADDARAMLRHAMENCRKFHPYEQDAVVLLPDHLHLLITLPDGDADFSRRITYIKSAFTRSFLAAGGSEQPRSTSRLRQRSCGVWQRRFWEHTIRNSEDLNRHYNPVKHKYVCCPHAWPHSTFHRFVAQSRYRAELVLPMQWPSAERH